MARGNLYSVSDCTRKRIVEIQVLTRETGILEAGRLIACSATPLSSRSRETPTVRQPARASHPRASSGHKIPITR